MADIKLEIAPRGSNGGGGETCAPCATSLVGPTSGPGRLICDEDIPAGFVVSGDGSAVLAVATNLQLNRFPVSLPFGISCCDLCPKDCIWDPFETPPLCFCSPKPIGVSVVHTQAGQVSQYVAAGPLALNTSDWDRATGGTGGLVPHLIYYLSQTDPGKLISEQPVSGQAIKIGTALTSTVLNVQIESGQTDGFTLLTNGNAYPGAYSVTGYGFASGRDFEGASGSAWQLAPAGILPGAPLYKNLIDGQNVVGQAVASAAAWLSSHVIGLSTPGVGSFEGIEQGKYVAGGLFEMTVAQWNAVWTASDPNRGGGSGLLPGYPYYLSDVAGTSFLINKTGAAPVVASGNFITKCFVALSPTMVEIQIGDPLKNTFV